MEIPALDLNAARQQYFGFPHFRPGQEDVLGHILAGRDALVVMPTGSGKSLIYQLAALLLPGTTLVISPLIALMKDQTDSLARRKIPATFINSSMPASQQERRLSALARREYKLVYVAPERLRSHAFQEALNQVTVSVLVVDEAHCLSQWGHDFRPDYLHVAEARDRFGQPVTLALTATATIRVQDDILSLLGRASAERVVTGFNRPNLTLEVLYAPDVNAKLRQLTALLKESPGAGIIYTGTRRDAEEVAEFVREVAGLEAQHYHAGLEAATRSRVQDAFLAGDLPVVVATNAFGMGIDRPDVRFVLHYSMPGTLEAYYQEAGRAGRDGLPARAVLLYSPQDVALQEFFIETAAPSASSLRAVYEFIKGASPAPHATESAATRGANRMDVANAVLSLEEIERGTGLPGTKVKVAVEQLEASGAVRRDLDVAPGVLRIAALPLPEAALQRVAREVATRREHKRSLLHKMVQYTQSDQCRRRLILDYFGDPGPADAPLCCDNHMPLEQAVKAESRLAETQAERAALIVLDTVARLPYGLGPEKVARVLKGSAAKDVKPFAGERNYGKFAALRIPEIRSLVAQLVEAGYLKHAGVPLPVLKLAPRGAEALKNRAAIQVALRPVRAEAAKRLKAAREASDTVTLTSQLLARGMSPEKIAAERGLSPSTIYSHLATLIAQGQVSVNQVVPAEVQQQIRAAIKQLGSADYLAPIKALLLEEIDYGVIRCVAEAWKREQQKPLSHPEILTKPSLPRDPDATAKLFERLRAWRRETARTENVPAFVVFSDEVLRNIASSSPRSPADLLSISGIGPNKLGKYGSKILALIEEIEGSNIVHPSPAPPPPISPASTGDPVAAFLSRPHPRPLTGPWLAGWALDFHSRFEGSEYHYTQIGELAHRYKYDGKRELAAELAARWAELLAAHPELPAAHAVVPVPPSSTRDWDPVARLADDLAAQLRLPVLRQVLVKTRATELQKEMTALARKQANVAGAFALKGSVRGWRLLLVDDLYDSGATLAEATRVLMRGGALSVVVLTLTKTIHADA